MREIKRILTILFIILLFFLLTSTFKNPHKEYYDVKDSFIFSKGNAPEDVRSEIINQLQKFQEGYTKRDTSLVKPFMQELFSKENIVILGTMPNEIYIGYDEATDIVRTDWESWGDCKFLMENAQISLHNDVAWISTIGHVKFDICKLLDMPLRFSAVLVYENDSWKFQQMQFQFDLDFSFNLICIILLIIWFTISSLTLVVMIIRRFYKPNKIVK